MVAIFNMVLVVGGSFVFGYKAVELGYDDATFTMVCIFFFLLFESFFLHYN